MKPINWLGICLWIFFVSLIGGALLGYHFKKCPAITERIDTVWIPGKTVVVEKPKPKKSYPVVRNSQTTEKKDSSNCFPDAGNMFSACDSIRTYEYSDSAVTIKDSIQGVLLQQTIIYKPAAKIIKTIVRDTAVFQSGFYLGGSAGKNSIRIEGEYLNKSGYSFTAGYDLINRTPVVGIRRKIW